MNSAAAIARAFNVPKKQRRPFSYSEDANEGSQVVKDESVDVEQEAPDRENTPVERIAPEKPDAAVFEE